MMDQILAGQPQASPVQPARRDQQNASGAGGAENSESFEDHVSKAGQQENQQHGRDDRGNAVDEKTSGEDALPETVVRGALGATVETVRRNAQDSAESRIRLALFKQSQKAAVQTEAGKNIDPEKALAKMLDAAKHMAQKAVLETARAPAVQEAAATTPSEELSLLLGLKPGKEPSLKSNARHEAEREADKADAKEEKAALHAENKA
jgi:hypothetical protein